MYPATSMQALLVLQYFILNWNILGDVMILRGNFNQPQGKQHKGMDSLKETRNKYCVEMIDRVVTCKHITDTITIWIKYESMNTSGIKLRGVVT